MSQQSNDIEFRKSIETLILNNKINEALYKAQYTKSSEVKDLIVDACVSNGQIENAFRAVKIRGEPLSLNEKDRLIRICLEKNRNRNEIKKALIVAKQGVSLETIDLLVKAYIDRRWFDRAIEAENLGCSKSTRDELVKICIKNRKNSGIVQKAIDLAQKGVSQKLLDSITEICIYNGWLDKALSLIKLGNSEKFFSTLKNISIENGLYDIALALVDFTKEDLSEEDKDSLVKSCIAKRSIDDVIRTAELRGKDLSAEEKEFLVKRWIMAGNVNNLNKALQLRGLPLSESEKVSFVEAFTKKEFKNDEELSKVFEMAKSGLPQTSLDLLVKIYVDRQWGQHAMEIAKFGASHKTIDHLVKLSVENRWYRYYPSDGYHLVDKHLSRKDKETLLKNCISNGWVRDALIVAKMLGKRLSEKERNSIAKVFINTKWNYCGNSQLEEENTAIANTYVVGGRLDDALSTAQHASKETIYFIIESFNQRDWL